MARLALIAVGLSGCAGYGVPTSDTGNDDDGPDVIPLDTDTEETTDGPLRIDDLDVNVHETIESILVVTWTQNTHADAHLEFSFEEGIWRSSPVKSRDAGPQTELILGVPYDTLVTWRLVLSDGTIEVKSDDDLVSTGAYPYDAPFSTVHVNEPDLVDSQNAPYFLVAFPVAGESWAGSPWWALIVDREARPVWALESPFDRSFMHARVAWDKKTLLLDHNAAWPDNEADASEVVRTWIDGTVDHVFPTPGLHHPFTDLPDGSIAYGAEEPFGEHILIAHEDGEVEDIFDCQAWLASVGGFGYCASNTITYIEATNKFLFSHYPFETIIEVDRDTGNVERWWGDANSTWDFNPPDSKFTWQHGANITPEGHLLTSCDTIGGTVETVVREYRIDDEHETLHQEKTYGFGEDLYGGVMGEAYYLPNGNLLRNTGAVARVQEFTPDGAVVWDVEWFNGAIGRSMPIVDLYALEPPSLATP